MDLNTLTKSIRRFRGEKRSFLSELSLVLRLLAGILSTFVVCCAVTVPIGLGGYLAALFQWFVIGAVLLRRKLRWMSFAAAVACGVGVCIVWQNRYTTVHGPATGEAAMVPPASGARAINWLISEEDGVFLAARVLSILRGITPHEANGLLPQLEEAYRRFRKAYGDSPTPLIATTLLLQSSSSSDLLVLRSRVAPQPNRRALLFLHGFAGNWSLLCFLVSESASAFDTFCPSVGLTGMWGVEPGPELVERLVLELRKKGYTQIILAGLSAGAAGASEIASRNPEWFDGLVLLFGAHPDASNVNVPTLYVFGTRDERFPPAWVARFAKSHLENKHDVTIRPLPLDHFALIKNTREVGIELEAWLSKHFP